MQVNNLISKITGEVPDRSDAVGVLSGMLWHRPEEIRRHTFQSYNQFRTRGYTDPSLVRDLIEFRKIIEIDVEDTDWEEKYYAELSESGFVALVSDFKHRELLQLEVCRLIAQPVNVGYLQYFPSVYEITKGSGRNTVTFILKEAV